MLKFIFNRINKNKHPKLHEVFEWMAFYSLKQWLLLRPLREVIFIYVIIGKDYFSGEEAKALYKKYNRYKDKTRYYKSIAAGWIVMKFIGDEITLRKVESSNGTHYLLISKKQFGLIAKWDLKKKTDYYVTFTRMYD